jgi:flagellin-like protein
MEKKLSRKRGLSPIITTVLLIALTIVITAIVFLWFRGMVQEGVLKFDKNIQLSCGDVDFETHYSSGTLEISNLGSIAIYTVNLKMTSPDGSYKTKDIKNLNAGANWPKTGLLEGGTFSGNIGTDVGTANQITVLPVLIGTSGSGKKTFLCGGEYGKQAL